MGELNEDAGRRRRARALWKKAGRLAREQMFEADPLEKEELEKNETERVERWRWKKNEWVVDETKLKVSPAPFAEGSMRICWYAKKMSSQIMPSHIKEKSKHASWLYQRNYVLKTYKESKAKGGGARLRRMLEEDVITQAEAKAMAEEYNSRLSQLLIEGKFDRRYPKPMKYKCVDMLEPSLVVFIDRVHKPAFFMEAYISGTFKKYNNNAGYVSGMRRSDPDASFDDDISEDEDEWRATPQAFSHFSFVHSQGERIVVDLQGVGDLFTDPQIHTRDNTGFGLGNGGLRGIALFFATHSCNRICKCMQLPPVYSILDHQEADPRHGEPPEYQAHTKINATHLALLSNLESTLIDAALDTHFSEDDSSPPIDTNAAITLAHYSTPLLYSALRAILHHPTTPNEKHSACFLARFVHKTLGFIYLDGNDSILQCSSPSTAIFHLAAAALGNEATARHFLKTFLDHTDQSTIHALSSTVVEDEATRASQEYGSEASPRPQRKKGRLADAATRAAAAAVLAFAVHNISTLLLR